MENGRLPYISHRHADARQRPKTELIEIFAVVEAQAAEAERHLRADRSLSARLSGSASLEGVGWHRLSVQVT